MDDGVRRSVAGDFYLLAHDDRTGRPRLHRRAVDLGLAAALLAELLYLRRITVGGGEVHVVDRTPPADALAHGVLEQLVAEPQHVRIRIWLDFLSMTASEQVAGRLLVARQVRRETTRRLLRTVTTYVPVDMNAAALPWARLSRLLSRGEPLSYLDTCLAGLTTATGLDTLILDGAPRAVHVYVRSVVTSTWPPLRELIAQTAAAVGGSVLSHRT
jgi:hypothetical protein